MSTPARRISPWWWVAGGCVALLVLTIAAGVVVAIVGWHALVGRFTTGGFSCLPADFPTYPGATFAGQTYDLNANTTPGNFCEMKYSTNDPSDTVLDVYASRLNSGNWEVVPTTPVTPGEIDFQNKKNSRKHGSIVVDGSGGHTGITVDYYSP